MEGDFIQTPFLPPEQPEGRTKRLYLEKIIRLCTLCQEMMGEEDPIAWYRARYPELSDRTRQRDFQELAAAGCGVHYVSAADSLDGEKSILILVLSFFAFSAFVSRDNAMTLSTCSALSIDKT